MIAKIRKNVQKLNVKNMGILQKKLFITYNESNDSFLGGN